MENCIKEIRIKKQISQLDLAEKCNVTRQTINAVENQKYDPTISLAFNIANSLGERVDDLFIFKKRNS